MAFISNFLSDFKICSLVTMKVAPTKQNKIFRKVCEKFKILNDNDQELVINTNIPRFKLEFIRLSFNCQPFRHKEIAETAWEDKTIIKSKLLFKEVPFKNKVQESDKVMKEGASCKRPFRKLRHLTVAFGLFWPPLLDIFFQVLAKQSQCMSCN